VGALEVEGEVHAGVAALAAHLVDVLPGEVADALHAGAGVVLELHHGPSSGAVSHAEQTVYA
jgi:hypothetical protein